MTTRVFLKHMSIYYVYFREDKAFLQKLDKHLEPLKRSMQIETWHDTMIPAGSFWEQEIDAHLSQSGFHGIGIA